MNVNELQDLLRRCERDDAIQADLAQLEAILAEQERQEGWGAIREGLCDGLLTEGDRVDLASGVIHAVAPENQAIPTVALEALRGGLREEATKADSVDAVMHFVEPVPDAALARAFAALAQGLEVHARGYEAPTVTRAVMDRVDPSRDMEMDQAFDALAEGLTAQAASVELVDSVMHEVVQTAAWQLQLCAMADGELDLEARRAVAARLSDDAASRHVVTRYAELGRSLRHALAHEVSEHDLSAIWPAVETALGIQPQASWADVASGIQAEAGEIDIAELVMGQLLPSAPEARRDADAVAEDHTPAPERAPAAARPMRQPWYRRLSTLAFAASAAAMLLLVPNLLDREDPLTPDPQPLELAEVFEISDVNDTKIEELVVAENAMVQVFQLGDGAPMVIFIDEGIEDEMEGVTL